MEALFLYSITEYQLHLVTLAAIILNREGVFALVVAGPAGFAGFHVAHGGLKSSCLEREYFCVAVGTLVIFQMYFVAECSISTRGLEGDYAGF